MRAPPASRHFDPPRHRATLLHYVAANGVEGYRQRTPANAVDVARVLLDAGAAPDSLAQLYGGDCTTMTLLVSSSHPARAGVQVALVDVLVDYGASVEPIGQWRVDVAAADGVDVRLHRCRSRAGTPRRACRHR